MAAPIEGLMAGAVRVGTSGWRYDDWRDTVYPPGVTRASWFEQYTSWFPSVEVNATFYRLARTSAAEKWAQAAPPGFEYVFKGSRFITHRLKLRDASEALDRFFAPLTPVSNRTAVILWQLPPQFKRNVDRLDAFLNLLPPTHRYAVEFRDDDWFDTETYEVLDRHGAANVWLSSTLTSAHECVATGNHVYMRFHGLSRDPYRHDYTDDELRPWAERLSEAAASNRPVYAFFNNDYQGHAVRNARRFIELLGDAAKRWPPRDAAIALRKRAEARLPMG